MAAKASAKSTFKYHARSPQSAIFSSKSCAARMCGAGPTPPIKELFGRWAVCRPAFKEDRPQDQVYEGIGWYNRCAGLDAN